AGRPQPPLTVLQSAEASFRPTCAAIGPDGAVYLAAEPGLIYRLSWSGTASAPAIPLAALDRWSKLTAETEDALLAQLESPSGELRRRAGEQLARRAPQRLAA